jgi:hypothetical protein
MFAHSAFRPVWPVVLFLPWLLVGMAYIVEALLTQRRARSVSMQRAAGAQVRPRPRRIGAGLMVLGLVGLAANHVARADPATAATPACEASGPQEARQLADQLYEGGEYRRAGACYDLAGDPVRAQRAYLKAAGPSSEATARRFKEQGNTASAVFSQVQHAFRGPH